MKTHPHALPGVSESVFAMTPPHRLIGPGSTPVAQPTVAPPDDVDGPCAFGLSTMDATPVVDEVPPMNEPGSPAVDVGIHAVPNDLV